MGFAVNIKKHCPASGLLAASAVFALVSPAAFAQQVISAHSGVVNLAEGSVFVNDKPFEQKFAAFPELGEKGTLRTEAGRAEILLTPGVFLRVGENTSLRMISNRLADTRVELLSGDVIVESNDSAGDKSRETSATIQYKDSEVGVDRNGIFRFSGDPAALKVFDGVAMVKNQGHLTQVKAGEEMAFDGTGTIAKFDGSVDDPLYNWAKRRSSYVAAANVSAAKIAAGSSFNSGYNSTGLLPFGYSPYGGYGYGGYGIANAVYNPSGSWFLNPYYGMYTYMPFGGAFASPFGYIYWSPTQLAPYYYNPYGYYSGGSTVSSLPGKVTGVSGPSLATIAHSNSGGMVHHGGSAAGRIGSSYSSAAFRGGSGGLSSTGLSSSPSTLSLGSARSGGGMMSTGGGGHTSGGHGK